MILGNMLGISSFEKEMREYILIRCDRDAGLHSQDVKLGQMTRSNREAHCQCQRWRKIESSGPLFVLAC